MSNIFMTKGKTMIVNNSTNANKESFTFHIRDPGGSMS